MTAFNREKYIADAIESVLNSTFADFELIIVDDQSRDGTADIARDYAKKDPRIKLHINSINLGDYPNRNKAASLASGVYLKYLDADDLMYPHALAVMVDIMDRTPGLALAMSGRKIDPPSPYPIITNPRETLLGHYFGGAALDCGPSAAIIRRKCFEEVGGFSGKRYFGDCELWLRLAERWPFASIPPALVWWRQHEDQQIRFETSSPEIVEQRYLMQRQFLVEGCHLSEEERFNAIACLEQHVARSVFSVMWRTGQFNVAWKRFRNSGISWKRLLSGLRAYY